MTVVQKQHMTRRCPRNQGLTEQEVLYMLKMLCPDLLSDSVPAAAIDCRIRALKDDPNARLYHSGLHPMNFAGITSSKEWRQSVLPEFAHKLRSLCDHDQDEVTMVFWCNQGKHRSVATALAARHLLECTTNMPVPCVTHRIEQSSWACLSSTSGTCGLCFNRRVPTRDDALYDLRCHWREHFIGGTGTSRSGGTIW